MQELEKCWESSLSGGTGPSLRVDLTGVTFIDAAGKDRLAAMHSQGAEFVADDLVTKAIVEEITGRRSRKEDNVP